VDRGKQRWVTKHTDSNDRDKDKDRDRDICGFRSGIELGNTNRLDKRNKGEGGREGERNEREESVHSFGEMRHGW